MAVLHADYYLLRELVSRRLLALIGSVMLMPLTHLTEEQRLAW